MGSTNTREVQYVFQNNHLNKEKTVERDGRLYYETERRDSKLCHRVLKNFAAIHNFAKDEDCESPKIPVK
jgi:hypothetical protein